MEELVRITELVKENEALREENESLREDNANLLSISRKLAAALAPFATVARNWHETKKETSFSNYVYKTPAFYESALETFNVWKMMGLD